MKRTFIEDLKRTDIGVVATANNNDPDGIQPWIRALARAKPKILRDFKKHPRPYFSIIQKTASVRTEAITTEMKTRRTRPSEKEGVA